MNTQSAPGGKQPLLHNDDSTRPPGGAQHTPTPKGPRSAFDRFYHDGRHPEDAMDLAVADAIHAKMEHSYALMAYREQRNALRAAVEALLPYAEGAAKAAAQIGWASRSQAAVDAAKAALNPSAK